MGDTAAGPPGEGGLRGSRGGRRGPAGAGTGRDGRCAPAEPPPRRAAGARGAGAQRCRPLTERLGAGTALAFWREFACGQCCAAEPAPSSHYTLLYL